MTESFKSATSIARFSVEALSSPLFYTYCFHLRTLKPKIKGQAYFFEELVAAIYQHLGQIKVTSLYFASMFLIILRQSLGLFVISPNTLLFLLFGLSLQLISTISFLILTSFSCKSESFQPYYTIFSSLTFLSIGLAIFSMSLNLKRYSSMLRHSWSIFSSSVSQLFCFLLRKTLFFFLLSIIQ